MHLERVVLSDFKPDSLRNSNKTGKILARNGNEGLRNNDPHSCCFCQNIYLSHFSLIDHLDSVNCQSNKIACDLCPKIFFTKKGIRNHVQLHEKKKFECNICDYSTVKKSHLKRHKITHEQIPRYECSICHKRVREVRAHMKTHTAQKKTRCVICKKMMAEVRIKVHMKRHNYLRKCDNCEETFKSHEDLRR